MTRKQREEMEAMDAQVLALIRQRIKENPDDDEWKRLYAICKAAIPWKEVPLEHQEAVLDALAGQAGMGRAEDGGMERHEPGGAGERRPVHAVLQPPEAQGGELGGERQCLSVPRATDGRGTRPRS